MTALQKASILAAAALALCSCATTKPGSGSDGDPGAGNSASGSGSEAGTPVVLAKVPAPPQSGGSAAPESRTASSTTRAGGTASSSGSAVPAETSEERRSTIDRQLNDSLGTFDSELRKEQERVAKERDERAASSAGTAHTDEDGDEEADGASDKDGGSADTQGLPGSEETKEADGKRPGDLKSEGDRKAGDTSAGSAGGSGRGAANIPDGSDDDIVARRLRKAAEAETDPELKEKLWKEYVEYKKNTQK